MDFGFEKVTNYYLNIEQYEWYSDDLKKYLIKLEQNASCIVGIFAKFWYWGNLTKVQAKQHGIKNKSEDYERWIKLLNKSMNTLEYEYKTDNESNDDFDDNEIVSDCYEPNLSSIPNYILRKLFTFCLYSEENFENWVLKGVSKKKKLSSYRFC